MKQIWKLLLITMVLVLCPLLLAGCGQPEAVESEQEEIEQEQRETWVQTYETTCSAVAEAREAVMFQQGYDEGFLAYINRKVREEIPPELAEDPAFVNDGSYDVYESALFRVTKSGKRHKVRRYRQMPAPENPEGLEHYFSEARPRAFRMREDGSILSIESSYEAWHDGQTTKTRDRYFVRVLQENGVEISCREIETTVENSPDCENAVYLGADLLAMPMRNEILFFGVDGTKQFSVSTPFPVRELCRTAEGNLAVLLNEDGNLWMSVIHIRERSAEVPQKVPDGAHSICAGQEDHLICFIRNSEIFTFDFNSGACERQVSLYSLGIAPFSVGGFFTGPGGEYRFLLHRWNAVDETISEQYLIAAPAPVEIQTEKRMVRIGFSKISNGMSEAILNFNRNSSSAFLETVDFRNMEEHAWQDAQADILVMDDELFLSMRESGNLLNLAPLVQSDPTLTREDFFPSVWNAMADGDENLYRISAGFRLESMACDRETAAAVPAMSLEGLKEYYFSEMPAGSLLYEPYYTADRLLEDLCTVNREQLGSDDERNNALYAQLLNYSALQPSSYSYSDYSADSASMESRIYAGRLMMLQAHISSLEDLKWYDAFFEHGAFFAGWPTEDGYASRIVFDENVGILSGEDTELEAAAWSFLRTLLSEDYSLGDYAFPVIRETLEKQMADDAAAVTYRVDEKGKFELDKNGNRIEIARSSWYSPEWRRHYVYAITAEQQEKLMKLIEQSV